MIPPRVLRALDELGPLLAKQGSIIATWRSYKGRRIGPYYRVMFRHNGRLQSAYLGKDGELAAIIQSALDLLREPGRQQREFARLRRQIKRSLMNQKSLFRQRLREQGRDLKGFEIRRLHPENVKDAGAHSTIPKEGKIHGHDENRSTGNV